MPRAQSYPDNHQEFSGKQKSLNILSRIIILANKGLEGKFTLRTIVLYKLNMVGENKVTKSNPNTQGKIYGEI